MVAVHSNPLTEPGFGDGGGMTVYVRQVARALAARGLQVDVYTRRDGSQSPEEVSLYPGVRVIQVTAGEPSLPKDELPAYLPEFSANLWRGIEQSSLSYDLIHSHYWLSGRVASILARRLEIPFVHSFHTLGRVKNQRLRERDGREPPARLQGEARVIAEADAIVASTPEERRWLVEFYAAHPTRVRVIPPGVDHEIFTPGDKAAAKRHLGLAGKRVLLFVGRLQPFKAAGTAIRALAQLRVLGLPEGEAILVIVGGPSPSGSTEPARLRTLADQLGMAGSVRFVSAQPHQELPVFYQAADVCLVPSLAETFGLVALEAQACGVPVVASGVGGLRSVVRHGQTGFLVDPSSSASFAERSWSILADESRAESMGRIATYWSNQFSWERSAADLYDLYVSSSNVWEHRALLAWDAKKVCGTRRNVACRS